MKTMTNVDDIVAPTDDCRVAVGVFVHGFSRVRGYL